MEMRKPILLVAVLLSTKIALAQSNCPNVDVHIYGELSTNAPIAKRTERPAINTNQWPEVSIETDSFSDVVKAVRLRFTRTDAKTWVVDHVTWYTADKDRDDNFVGPLDYVIMNEHGKGRHVYQPTIIVPVAKGSDQMARLTIDLSNVNETNGDSDIAFALSKSESLACVSFGAMALSAEDLKKPGNRPRVVSTDTGQDITEEFVAAGGDPITLENRKDGKQNDGAP
jgi:hypothetical protein